jgi:hypothetical protein
LNLIGNINFTLTGFPSFLPGVHFGDNFMEGLKRTTAASMVFYSA